MPEINNQNNSNDKSISRKFKPRMEHIALNVPDPVAMAKWYCEYLGMRVMRKGPSPVNMHFIADSAGKIMLELYNNTTAPLLDFISLNPLCLHLAFMSTDLKATRDLLINVGAKVEDDIATIPNGDQILMMRDPWGFSIQFVKRLTPMFQPISLRPEHLGLNVVDPEKMAQWYCENLNMTIMRKGTPPTCTNFFSDSGLNMILEVYNNTTQPILDMPSMHLLSLHIAFMVGDIKVTRDKLLNAGATVLEDLKTIENGDSIMILRDPWGLPIQFLNRVEPMLA